MTASTAAPTYSSTFYSGPPPHPPTSSTVRPEQQPPQLAYGWWVDVLPPRGPYLWPCHPDGYEIAQPTHFKHEHNNDATKLNTDSSSSMDTADSSAVSPSSFLTQPPQMAFGWYCAEPPRAGPFFWSCLPPGYQLVPSKQWEQMMAATRNVPLTTTTRQGNVTLTLPTTSASLASTLAAASSTAATTPSPSPSPLPSSISPSDPLNAPSPTLSLSNFYPASKTHSISNLLSSPPLPVSTAASLPNDSLSFLNLSQSQDDGLGLVVVPPMPSRSPALEGLAAVAGEERADAAGSGGSDFQLDSVVSGSGGGGGGTAGASLGSVEEGDEMDGGGEDDEGGQSGLRRGKRKRTAKVRG